MIFSRNINKSMNKFRSKELDYLEIVCFLYLDEEGKKTSEKG